MFSCYCRTLKKQLAFLLARQSIVLDTGDLDLNELMSNARLSENFLALARDLDIMEPKVPEDIYKSHLEPSRMSLNRWHTCCFAVNGVRMWRVEREKGGIVYTDTMDYIWHVCTGQRNALRSLCLEHEVQKWPAIKALLGY